MPNREDLTLLQLYLFPPHLRDSKVSQGADHTIESVRLLHESVFQFTRKVTVGEGGFELSPHPQQQCNMSQAQFCVFVHQDGLEKLNQETEQTYLPDL